MKGALKNFTIMSLSYFCYRITLDYLYVNAINPLFDYQHFVLNLNSVAYALSFIWCFFILLFDIKLLDSERPSAYIVWFIDLFFYIPLSSIIPLAGMKYSFFTYCILFWLLSSLFYLKLPHYSKFPGSEVCSVPGPLLVVAVGIILINFLVTVYYNGFSIKLDLADVYDIRMSVRELNLPAIVGYLKPLASKLGLILLCVFIIRRKVLWIIVLTLIQLMNFAFGALKGDLLILIVVYLIGFIYKPGMKRWIPMAFVLANVAAIVEYKVQGYSSLCIVVQRRLMYMPPLLSSEFFDFFSSHELLYLRDSILRYFGFSSPYRMEIPRLIGYEFYDSYDMNANTGIIGDDFAQFGWIALMIYPYFRVKLYQLYDYSSKGIDSRVVLFLGVSFSISFISGSLFSILLTGSFLAVCLLFYLWSYTFNSIKYH